MPLLLESVLDGRILVNPKCGFHGAESESQNRVCACPRRCVGRSPERFGTTARAGDRKSLICKGALELESGNRQQKNKERSSVDCHGDDQIRPSVRSKDGRAHEGSQKDNKFGILAVARAGRVCQVRAMKPLQDLWLPEVEAKYAALLALSRDIGVDVGNQFRAFEHLYEAQPGYRLASHRLHGLGESLCDVCATCDDIFAVAHQQAAIVKWTVVGTEHQQRMALAEAKQRTLRVFP